MSAETKIRAASAGYEQAVTDRQFVAACNYANISELLAELDALRQRIIRADTIILQLTADHNTGKNYVKGFDAANEYFSEINEIEDAAMKKEKP